MTRRQPHVVIVGGGFGGLSAAKALSRASVRVTLIDQRNHHVFQPLLYQVATAGLSAIDIGAAIREILRRARNITVLMGRVESIDMAGRRLSLSTGPSIDYDYLKLADWIDQNASFPNAMVDCIAPAVGPKEIALVQSLGIDDAAPVTHEPFRQWVIEDDFCAGRPAWDKVGATFTEHVHNYEAMKLRILNAGHSVIAEAGQIMGVETIADCMTHPTISAYFKKLETEEIAPTVAPVPERTPQSYVDLIVSRFSNPRIIDTTKRVASDGSSKHPGFILPILRDQMAAGRSFEGLALVEAVWARMCEGTREDGSAIERFDPDADDLAIAARAARERPAAWLEQTRYYGDLKDVAPFADAFSAWLTLIWSEGCAAALSTYLASEVAMAD